MARTLIGPGETSAIARCFSMWSRWRTISWPHGRRRARRGIQEDSVIALPARGAVRTEQADDQGAPRRRFRQDARHHRMIPAAKPTRAASPRSLLHGTGELR